MTSLIIGLPGFGEAGLRGIGKIQIPDALLLQNDSGMSDLYDPAYF